MCVLSLLSILGLAEASCKCRGNIFGLKAGCMRGDCGPGVQPQTLKSTGFAQREQSTLFMCSCREWSAPWVSHEAGVACVCARARTRQAVREFCLGGPLVLHVRNSGKL